MTHEICAHHCYTEVSYWPDGGMMHEISVYNTRARWSTHWAICLQARLYCRASSSRGRSLATSAGAVMTTASTVRARCVTTRAQATPARTAAAPGPTASSQRAWVSAVGHFLSSNFLVLLFKTFDIRQGSLEFIYFANIAAVIV